MIIRRYGRHMSGYELTAHLVASLAWPVAALLAVVILRRSITALLTGPLRRMKIGPVEAEFWDRIMERAEEGMPPTKSAPPTPDVGEDLDPDAELVPQVAVLEAYGRLERELREVLARSGVEPLPSGAVRLARLAERKTLISSRSVRSIEGLGALRNLVAHGAAGEVTTARAREYLAMVDAILYTIRYESGDGRASGAGLGDGSGYGGGSASGAGFGSGYGGGGQMPDSVTPSLLGSLAGGAESGGDVSSGRLPKRA